MQKIAAMVLLLLIFEPHTCAKVSVKWYQWYDSRVFFVDLVMAQSLRGETVLSMVKRTGGVAGINATYFGRKPSGGGVQRFAIGTVYFHQDDFTYTPAPADRPYLWQTEFLQIGFQPPKETIFTIQPGPILIHRQTLLPSYPQNFDAAHWNRRCLRTIVAIKGHRFYLFKLHGNLWEIAKYLHRQGFEEAESLDGGTSSQNQAHVPNALVVFRKSRPFYQAYFCRYLLPKNDDRPAAKIKPKPADPFTNSPFHLRQIDKLDFMDTNQ